MNEHFAGKPAEPQEEQEESVISAQANSSPSPLITRRVTAAPREMGVRRARLPLPTHSHGGGHRISPVRESPQDTSPKDPGPGCRGSVSGRGSRGPWALIPTRFSSPSRSSVSAWQTESLGPDALLPAQHPSCALQGVPGKRCPLSGPQLKSSGADMLPSGRGRPLKRMAPKFPPNELTSLGTMHGEVQLQCCFCEQWW